MTKDGYLTITECARILRDKGIKISNLSIRNWANDKKITGYKVGSRWYIQKSDFLEYIGIGDE